MSSRPLPLVGSAGSDDPLRATQRASQRQRLIDAVGRALAEEGCSKLTIAAIVRRAHVSRRTFYENFDDPEAALIVAHETVAEWLLARMREQALAADDWPEQLRAALDAALAFAAAEPHLARLVAVDHFGFSRQVALRTHVTRERLAALLRPARDRVPPPLDLPPTTELLLVCGATAVIGRRLLTARESELATLGPELLEFLLQPYLGAEQAARIARRPADPT